MARVAFCQDTFVEYMGYMSMSAVLKEAGHEVRVFCDSQSGGNSFLRQVLEFRPQIAGFSVLTPTLPWALETAARIKRETGVLTVFGNVHAIVRPEIIENDAVDLVCLGEGEYCMRALCDALDKGSEYVHLPGFHVKKDGIIHRNPMRETLADLDKLPYPDRQLYNRYRFFRHSRYLKVSIGRGCPHSCTFCYNPLLREKYKGRRYIRRMQPENAVAMLEHLIAEHPVNVKYIIFIDEVLWVSNEWLREFFALYRDRIGLPFTGNYRFGAIEEDDIRLLAEAGSDGLLVACETADEKKRFELMEKKVTNEQIIRITGLLRKYGIAYGMTQLFGLPGDTFEKYVEELSFYRDLDPIILSTFFFYPYPGIALQDNPDVQRLMPADDSCNYTLHNGMFLELPDRDRISNLKNVYHLCMKYPRVQPLLLWLCRFRIPILFKLLFMLHFTYYIFRIERANLYQFLVHLKTFAVNPVLRKLNHSFLKWRR
jgi:anaerobic magnesium-protoporphyrin IX monomethyl ester cyclase